MTQQKQHSTSSRMTDAEFCEAVLRTAGFGRFAGTYLRVVIRPRGKADVEAHLLGRLALELGIGEEDVTSLEGSLTLLGDDAEAVMRRVRPYAQGTQAERIDELLAATP